MTQMFLALRNSSTLPYLLPAFLIGLCLSLFTSQGAGQVVKKDDTDKRVKRDILVGSELLEPFDMGVNSSGGKTDWLSKEPDHMKMAFPANQKWAAVFVTVGEPTDPPRPSMDLSQFNTLSIEMRGAAGGERVEIGIKSNDQPDTGRETKKSVSLTPAWRVYEFMLDEFKRADLKNLYVVAEFVYNGTAAQTAFFKNIKYLKSPTQVTSQAVKGGATAQGGTSNAAGPVVTKDVKDQKGKKDILVGSELSEGFDMGVNSSGGKTDWLSKEPDHMKMAFPANQKWAAVFVTVGEPTDPPRPSMDFSEFRTLSIEMRGAVGGERVEIGIKSNDQPDTGRETKKTVALTPAWKVYEFPLDEFKRADLKNLYVVTEFVYNGTATQTVYFRNIKYLR